MRAFHNSRDIRYRAPFGAVVIGTPVELGIDIWDAPGASVLLRTWTEAKGEYLYPMELCAESPEGGNRRHYRVTICPDETDVLWYHFLIADPEGGAQRYGAIDGASGGVGCLVAWEPSSFQLTVHPSTATESAEGSALPEGIAYEVAPDSFFRNEDGLTDGLEAKLDYLQRLHVGTLLLASSEGALPHAGVEGLALSEKGPLLQNKKFLRTLRREAAARDIEVVVDTECREVEYRQMREALGKPALEQSLLVNTAFKRAAMRFLCQKARATELVEAIGSWYENYLPEQVKGTFNLLADPSDNRIMTCFGDAPARASLTAEERASYAMPDHKRGTAKGRLWCASLLQAFMPGVPTLFSGDELGVEGFGGPDGVRAFPWGAGDGDCRVIIENVIDLQNVFPLVREGDFSYFAANDDVIGIWRKGADGTALCLLVNASTQTGHEIPVPMEAEGVSDVISGYAVRVLDAHELEEKPSYAPHAARYALPYLAQTSAAVLLFHPQKRLQEPMEPAVGVLAHITSLPAEGGFGTIGEPARAFVDWLADAGVRYWQVLPVNPTDDFGSPYAGISAFAGNVNLLDATDRIECPDLELEESEEYRRFVEREADWLDPYSAFMAIRDIQGKKKAWQDWPRKYRTFNPDVVRGDEKLLERARLWMQRQFIFQGKWHELRSYANERGVKIIGDMPIYVSSNSVDVWSNQEIFQLGRNGRPEVVAGCPPDAFAADGQIWGNPVYDWQVLEQDGYRWWRRRLQRAFELYDVVRLDHFIGFARYFSIPNGEKATVGVYRPGPGYRFFEDMRRELGPLPMIAEDLGFITPAVRVLAAACGFPGMDIIQFVDGNDPLSWYQPRPEKIAYSGTHDNQTLKGYVAARYRGADVGETADILLRKVASSDAPVVVFALQDVIGLDDAARMNVPGTAEGNWMWQAKANEVSGAAGRARKLVAFHRERHGA